MMRRGFELGTMTRVRMSAMPTVDLVCASAGREEIRHAEIGSVGSGHEERAGIISDIHDWQSLV